MTLVRLKTASACQRHAFDVPSWEGNMNNIAQPELLPTTAEIHQAFIEEIATLGGAVSDVYDDGTRLFLRAVLPPSAEVRSDDHVQAGVAVRTSGPEILVHPYTFRVVCTNGAIRAHALESRRITRVEVTPSTAYTASFESQMALAAFGSAVGTCAGPQVFADSVQEMRSSAEIDADMLLALMPYFLRHARSIGSPIMRTIVQMLSAEPEPQRSGFGLLNAITARARDERDPELRWRLEALGGGVPAWLDRARRTSPAMEEALSR
jgi:hypothetical protein